MPLAFVPQGLIVSVIMKVTNVFERNIKAFNRGKELIINPGGTSSSKTYSIIQLLILLAHRRKYTISVVSETFPHLKKGAFKDFMDIMEADGLYDPKMHNKSDNVYQFGSGKIEFFSADTPSKVHGPRRDILYVNEAVNIPWDIFDQMNVRTNVCTFIDFNPTNYFWAHEYFSTGAKIEWIQSTYKDNKYLPEKIIRGIEAKKEAFPEWWKVYGLGELGNVEGVVFSNWKQVSEIPKDAKTLGYGLDFGFTNDPTTLIHVAMSDGQLYLKELIYETGMTNRDISKRFDEVGLVRGIDDIYADISEPKSIAELRSSGWAVHKGRGGGDTVIKGIDVMKQYPINVTSDSVNLIKEFRYYKWVQDKFTGKYLNKAMDGWNHAIDAARYCISSRVGKRSRAIKQHN